MRKCGCCFHRHDVVSPSLIPFSTSMFPTLEKIKVDNKARLLIIGLQIFAARPWRKSVKTRQS